MSHELEIPFVLRKRMRLPANAGAGPDRRYDLQLQLWVSTASGAPLVNEHIARRRNGLPASDFGETIATRTSEGIDQSEGVSVSEFGETFNTYTAEGTDQREALASDFGETVMTKTREGIDQREAID